MVIVSEMYVKLPRAILAAFSCAPFQCALSETAQPAAQPGLLESFGGKATKILGDFRLRMNLELNSYVVAAKKIQKIVTFYCFSLLFL